MHELGIVVHVINSIEQIAEEQKLSKVASVTLELGEVSGVVPAYLQDCWQWSVKKSELLWGAELICEQTPAMTLCHSCGEEYGTVAHGRTCPACGSGDTVLMYGNEMGIKEIEAY